MFSQKVEYSLRAVLFLASELPAAKTTAEISSATKVPLAYLSKVLQGLRRSGIVRSRRGAGGGVILVSDPAKLSILEVVNAVDPIGRITQCPLGLKSHGVNLCPLHKRMDNALATVEEALGASTLAEILAEPNPSIPLCDFPSRSPALKETDPR